jgi:hypothetical protein
VTVEPVTSDPIAVIVLRAMSVGVLLGSVAAIAVGLAVSSVGVVLYGSIFGALIGTLVGAANGIGLFLTTNRTRSRSVARVVAALGCAISGSCLVGTAGRLDTVVGLIFVGGCALAGVVVGPFVAFGRRSSIVIPVGKIAAYGALAGLALGATAGAAIGIALDPIALIPVALVIGGLVGAVPGALVAVISVPPMIWLWRCLRESH